MNRVLITGGHGLLGREIVEVFRDRHELRVTDREECDVTDLRECRRELEGFNPEAVIHCAAYTAVDRAEAEPEAAHAVNAVGTGNIARACRERGILLVTFGTDYVFDGALSRPYREEDPPRPISVYGKSKLTAEEAIREEGTEHLLIRSQWLYGPGGRNFILTILDKARAGGTIRVVSDQTGCPTYAKDLARAVLKLMDAHARGTVHFSNEGETTWFGLARFVLERAAPGLATLLPATSRELPYPAPRPAYSVLSKEKYRRITGESPRSWMEAAGEFIESIVGKGGR
jgi:dTDP-4-dehydrorhamnose reductase